MQPNFVWIITILTNVLMVTSSDDERPKRSLLFMKRRKANHFLYKTSNAFMKNYIKILYPVPNYEVGRNVMPVPYVNQNIYQELLPKIFIPSNIVMQPVINFRRPYITAFNERNYKTTYPNFYLSPALGKMQRETSVPNFNIVKVPLVRHNEGIAGACRKNVSKDRAEKISSVLSKLKSPKFPKLSRNTEEISTDVNDQRVAYSQYRNIIEIPTTASRVTERKIQPIKASTTYPSYTINLDQTKFSTAGTSSTTETMPIIASTKLVVTSQAAITSPSPPPLPVKNIQKYETLQPMFSLVKNKNEEINSTSTTRSTTISGDYMLKNDTSNNINPQRHSKNDVYKRVNSNKSNEDTVFKMDKIKLSKNAESQGELISQPSIFSHFIDVLNNIDNIGGNVHSPPDIHSSQDSDDTFEKLDSHVMEVNNHPTDIPSNTDDPSYSFYLEEDSQNKTNISEDFLKFFLPSDSDREISRGDVPDDVTR